MAETPRTKGNSYGYGILALSIFVKYLPITVIWRTCVFEAGTCLKVLLNGFCSIDCKVNMSVFKDISHVRPECFLGMNKPLSLFNTETMFRTLPKICDRATLLR